MFCANCGKEIPDDSLRCPFCGSAVAETVNTAGSQETEEGGKTAVKIVGAVAVVAVLAICVLLGKGLFDRFSSARKSDRDLVYQSDDELHYIKNYTKENIKDFEIADVFDQGEGRAYAFAGYDKNHKNAFFFSDFSDSKYRGTLCRIPLLKIGRDRSRNAKNIIEIADDVIDDYYHLKDGKIVFRTDDDDLVYYDGKKTYIIDEDVDEVLLVDEGNAIYAKLTKDDGYDVYTAKLAAKSNPEQIDEEVWLDEVQYILPDSDNFAYVRGDGDVCVWSRGKKAEEIAEDAILLSDNDSMDFYYAVTNERKINYLDFVEDDASQLPDIWDYMIEVSESYATSDAPENYENWMNYNDYMSSETGDDVDSYYNDDDDETYFYDNDKQKWYRLSEGYSGDYSKGELEAIKAALKGEKVTTATYLLSYYHNGKSQLIAELDRYPTISGDMAFYHHFEAENVRPVVTLSELAASVGYYYDVDDLTDEIDDKRDISDSDKEYCSVKGGAGIEVNAPGDDWYISSTNKDANRFVVSEYEDGQYELTEYVVKGDSVEKGNRFTKEGYPIGYVGDFYYYFDDIDTSENEGNLCSYDGSETKLIAKGVYLDSDSIYLLGKDSCVASEGRVDSFADGYIEDLCFYSNGDKEKLESDVRVNGTTVVAKDRILYQKDGDLYFTDGKKVNRRIAEDVQYMWTTGKTTSLSNKVD